MPARLDRDPPRNVLVPFASGPTAIDMIDYIDDIVIEDTRSHTPKRAVPALGDPNEELTESSRHTCNIKEHQ